MQCVLNRLLYVIFDKLPHINANFDFLPEPGGMENISIKQIMLEEKTSSAGMLHRNRGCFHFEGIPPNTIWAAASLFVLELP